MRPVPIARGDITVHNEGVLHGSGGNTIAATRGDARTSSRSVHSTPSREERRRGFTHSHNDDIEVLEAVDGLNPSKTANP